MAEQGIKEKGPEKKGKGKNEEIPLGNIPTCGAP